MSDNPTMGAYTKERLENAICFFAGEHHKKTHQHPWQTTIYKYLAFFDFELLRDTGRAPLDLQYMAMEHGPVPIELYREKCNLKSDLFECTPMGDNRWVFKATGKPDLDYFSEREIEKMNSLIYIYAVSWVKTGIMSESSHQAIRAWKVAYGRQPQSMIEKADTFADLDKKPQDQLTPAEEHFLTARSVQGD